MSADTSAIMSAANTVLCTMCDTNFGIQGGTRRFLESTCVRAQPDFSYARKGRLKSSAYKKTQNKRRGTEPGFSKALLHRFAIVCFPPSPHLLGKTTDARSTGKYGNGRRLGNPSPGARASVKKAAAKSPHPSSSARFCRLVFVFFASRCVKGTSPPQR